MKYLYRWLRAGREDIDSALYDSREEAQAARDAHAKFGNFGASCSAVEEVSDDYKPYYGHLEENRWTKRTS